MPAASALTGAAGLGSMAASASQMAGQADAQAAITMALSQHLAEDDMKVTAQQKISQMASKL